MLAYRVLRAADRLWLADAVTFTRKVKRRGVTKKGLAQGKRGRKPQGPQYPLSPCTPGRTAPPALMRSEHAVVRVSITHHPPKVGKPNLSNSGKPGVFHQPPSPQMLCRSRCSPCAPYGSPSRIHGSQSTSSEQENTERVLKEN